MTFSIVAYCKRTGQVGVAASTAVQSVGKLACHAIPQVGAIASQAKLNPYLAYDGLRLLQQGASAEEALKRVMAVDPDADSRQVGIVDMQGRTAAWTGSDNIAWAGHLRGLDCITQGNRLAGPQVLQAVLHVMHSMEERSLAERLVQALVEGAKAGGDLLGERSANVMVFSTEEYPLCDIRIDDHDHVIQELQRLYELFKKDILPNVLDMPRRDQMPEPDFTGLPGQVPEATCR